MNFPVAKISAFFRSSIFSSILKAVAAVVILLLVFQLGVFVGFHKANFSYRWGDNYHRNFGGPRGGFMRDVAGRDFIDGFGTNGIVLKVENDHIVVKGRNGVEKVLLISKDTSIEQGRGTVSLADIKPDQHVVVIGSPKEDGTIDAKIIRIFPITLLR